MKYKYIALDLDGTLLDNKHNIQKETKQLLIDLQAQGKVIILCSGRNISMMKKYAKELGINHENGFIVSDNGGTVTKLNEKNNETLREIKFSKQIVTKLNTMLSSKTKDYLVYNNSKIYYKRPCKRQLVMGLRHKSLPRYGINRAGSKILLIDSEENINKIYEQTKTEISKFNCDFNVFRSVPVLIEVTPPGSTKGSALAFLAKKYNFLMDDIIAFGDGENDIDMLEKVGHGVAMENAFDTTKKAADAMTSSNEDGGIYKYLKELNDN